jgi:hypothetical protein
MGRWLTTGSIRLKFIALITLVTLTLSLPNYAQAEQYFSCFGSAHRLLKKVKKPRRWALSKLEKEIQAGKVQMVGPKALNKLSKN